MNSHFLQYSLTICLTVLLLSSFDSVAQTKDQKPNYPDEIVPLRGKPFRGKILKFDGSTLYVEITKRRITQIITLSVDSLVEVNKDFGPTKISIWKRKDETKPSRKIAASPTIKMPKRFSNVQKDTVAALAVERDSIYVGAIDRKDTTAAAQNSLVDQRPIPLRRYNTEYPPAAISKRIEGAVKLRLWIDKEGVPRKYEIVESTDPIFVESSLASAMKWEFSPALVKGTPVGVWASISFEYRFQK